MADSPELLTSIQLNVQRVSSSIDAIKDNVLQLTKDVEKIEDDFQDHLVDNKGQFSTMEVKIATLQEESIYHKNAKMPSYALVLSIASFSLTILTTVAGVVFQLIKVPGGVKLP